MIQGMQVWTFELITLIIIILNAIQWSDGAKSEFINVLQEISKNYDEITIGKACAECKNMMDAIQKYQNASYKDIHFSRGKTFEPRESLKQFCTAYLLPVEYDDAGICDVITEHFLPPTQNQAFTGSLDICEISGVCSAVKESNIISISEKVEAHPDIQSPSTDKKKSLQTSSSKIIDTGADSIVEPRGLNLTRLGGGFEAQSRSANPITFVQISDIHLDLHYEQGSASRCRHKICCRSDTMGSGSAGRYGDYRCDSVKETVETLLASVAQLSPPPDFFIYVGDSPPHSNGRDESLAGKLSDNKAINDLMRQKLRAIAPIFPTLGNHDMYPENFYFSKGKHTKAILKELSVGWAELFPLDNEQNTNVQQHGFYTTLVREGLRILSINSLYAYRLNPVAFLSAFDPSTRRQYQFMRKTLDDAKSNSEKVIIMSHMKPSHVNTYAAYTLAMEKLVKDYQDVIILMLYGHEHTDTFVLSTDPLNRRRATGAFLAAPSITPYIYYQLGTNPSYRVFSLDRDSFKPLDYEQYYVDLKEANENNIIEVKKHYRFTEEYNLPDMGPQSFKTLADRISQNWDYYKKFERNKDVLVRRRRQCQKWNRFCRRILTCETTGPTKLRFRSCLLNPL